MGPTCSIAFENEPAEKNLMLQKPRKMTDSFFNFRELWMGIIQGIIIATAVLGVYYFAMDAGAGEKEVRTLAFITIVQANIFLTLSNRSFTQTIFQTIAIKNHLLWIMLGATFCILLATLLVPDVQGLFSFQSIGLKDFAFCSLAALLGTWWLEVYKFFRTRKT
jgi:Ca2+-transporting ATPase